ncbi:HPP family protein [Sphingomonas sp. M1-B02]|uniref:HPP family protein n=1 Tax=Sphingomonas sp. M1-B02 TaxID=3114300 RepID=UPI002240DCDC|nr:HPP family protein [Sphingomonas sp. S6-11]UZK67562.1 HPP family protein [Sphingomonas sp. S6-11]
MYNWFDRTPLLAGAKWRERGVAAIGAALGIGIAAWISTTFMGAPGAGLLLVAPMGASAVLIFAVPSSPMAQPWPVIAGNVVSALVGIGIANLLAHGALAAGVALFAAILAMSALRCLHPSGGATALLAILGGPAIVAQSYAFALVPVGLDAILLVGAGLAFHRISGHSYPHRAAPVDMRRLTDADVDAALAEADESFDISREDLRALLEAAERHGDARRARKPRKA